MKRVERSELLPCPFCGSADIDLVPTYHAGRGTPICTDCGANVGVHDTDEENNAAWNRRADNSELENYKAWIRKLTDMMKSLG